MGKLNVEDATKSLQKRLLKVNSIYEAKEYNAYMNGILDLLYALEESNPELTYELHKILDNSEEYLLTVDEVE